MEDKTAFTFKVVDTFAVEHARPQLHARLAPEEDHDVSELRGTFGLEKISNTLRFVLTGPNNRPTCCSMAIGILFQSRHVARRFTSLF
jgi:hypothetical protein